MFAFVRSAESGTTFALCADDMDLGADACAIVRCDGSCVYGQRAPASWERNSPTFCVRRGVKGVGDLLPGSRYERRIAGRTLVQANIGKGQIEALSVMKAWAFLTPRFVFSSCLFPAGYPGKALSRQQAQRLNGLSTLSSLVKTLTSYRERSLSETVVHGSVLLCRLCYARGQFCFCLFFSLIVRRSSMGCSFLAAWDVFLGSWFLLVRCVIGFLFDACVT